MRVSSLLWAAALFTGSGAFIIPDQLVSLLTVFYSTIPPVRKGTDSRVGVGFRFGPFADFQVLFELGPQSNTQAIGQPPSFSGKRDVDPDPDPEKQPALQLLDDVPSNARSGRVKSRNRARSLPSASTASPPRAPPPPPPPQQGDWLSRWRANFVAPHQQVIPSWSAEVSAPEPRWEAMQTLRRLYRAGRQV